MKKRIITVLLIVIIGSGLFIYYSDNKDSVKLPERIIEIKLSMTRVFLIKIPEGYLLFDTGYEKDYILFREILKNKRILLNQIKYLLISHHHDDHSGFINNIVKDNSSLRVIVYKKSVKLLAGGRNNKYNGGGIINRRVFALFRLKQILTPDWNLKFPPYKVRKKDIVLNDDLKLPDFVGLKGQIIYTPGHTSDSISLVIDNSYLLCGDLAANFLNWAGSSYATLFNENIEDVYRSWKIILNKNIKYIIPSHGAAFNVKRLRENINKYSQKDLVRFF